MSGAVLVTRPIRQGEDFARDLERAGLGPVLMAPMLEIQPVDFDAPEWSAYDGVLVTSANAVAFMKAVPRDMAVIAVGSQTASVLACAGFSKVLDARGSSLDVVNILDSSQRYLHVCGADVVSDMPENVDGLVVYEAVTVDGFSADVVNAFQECGIDSVVFFSARTAQHFMRLIDDAQLEGVLDSIKALCISQNVLDCVHTYRWARTAVSVMPCRNSMIEALKELNDE